MPGNSSSLWKAVTMAKDEGMSGIPEQLHHGGVLVRDGLVPDYLSPIDLHLLLLYLNSFFGFFKLLEHCNNDSKMFVRYMSF